MRECEAMETEIAMLKNKRSPSEVRRHYYGVRRTDFRYSLFLPAASDNRPDWRNPRRAGQRARLDRPADEAVRGRDEGAEAADQVEQDQH